MAEIQMNMSKKRIPEAQNWIEEAINADHRNETLSELGRDYSVKAEILRRKGGQRESGDTFKKAIKIFSECGADGWVKKCEQKTGHL